MQFALIMDVYSGILYIEHVMDCEVYISYMGGLQVLWLMKDSS